MASYYAVSNENYSRRILAVSFTRDGSFGLSVLQSKTLINNLDSGSILLQTGVDTLWRTCISSSFGRPTDPMNCGSINGDSAEFVSPSGIMNSLTDQIVPTDLHRSVPIWHKLTPDGCEKDLLVWSRIGCFSNIVICWKSIPCWWLKNDSSARLPIGATAKRSGAVDSNHQNVGSLS